MSELLYLSKTMKRILLAPLLFWMAGCGEPAKPGQAAPAAAVSDVAPYLLSVGPSGTVEAAKFNVQADGSSAFSVTGKGFVRGAAIAANGQKLATVFGNAGWLTATMPAVFYEKPGIVAIKVISPSGKESNSADFTVTAKK